MMKKVIHAIAVYGPIVSSGLIVLFLLAILTGWVFIPYNGYVWCGISTAFGLLVCISVKTDYNGNNMPKIEETGLLLYTSLGTAWWVYIWSTTKYTVILPFALVCILFTLYLSFKLCDDTVKRTLGLMAGSVAAMIGFIILVVPLLSPAAQIRERFSVYNGHSMVAKATVIRDAGNVYTVSVYAKKAGINLGIGRFEGSEEITVSYQTVDVDDYQKPEIVWQGEELYIDGEMKKIYWE